MNVRIKRLSQSAQIPKYAKNGDAGLDLVAISIERKYNIKYNILSYGTGIAIEIPEGYVGLIYPRSSIYKRNMRLSNSVGVIDSGYRGEITLNFNIESDDYNAYAIGERIGQLVIMPYPTINFIEVDELTESSRGEGGFGSTGN